MLNDVFVEKVDSSGIDKLFRFRYFFYLEFSVSSANYTLYPGTSVEFLIVQNRLKSQESS